MILAWMLYSAVFAGIVGIAALSLEGAARILGRLTRAGWVFALLLSVVLPVLLAARSMTAGNRTGSMIGEALLPPVIVTASRGAIDTLVARLASVAAATNEILVVAWIIVSSLLLLRLVLGVRSVRRHRSAWTQREVDGVPVLVSTDTGPAVVGIRRPTIVIPQWVLTLDSALRRLVLQHELEHVRAGDTVLPVLAALATTLMPWNPAIWWQANHLLLAAEVDCDARVLRRDVQRDRYGLLLLAIAQRQGPVMLGAALSEPTSHLEQRIMIMHRNTPRHPALVSSGLAALAAIVLMLACAAPAPAPDATATKARQPNESAAPFIAPTVEVSTPAPQKSAANAPTPAPSKAAYFEFKLTNRAVLAPGNKGPLYPAAMRAAGKEGEVLVQYVVDQNGAVEMSSLKVLKATDPAFVAAVREALPNFRYVPAQANGHAVKQLVQEPFMFTLKR